MILFLTSLGPESHFQREILPYFRHIGMAVDLGVNKGPFGESQASPPRLSNLPTLYLKMA